MASLIILSLTVGIASAITLPSDFMLLGIIADTQSLHELPCHSYRPFLGANTDYLCSTIPQLPRILRESNIQAQRQCQDLFRDHPWGCQLSSHVKPFRRFLRQASKEASFYTALASATLTLNLIDACIKGQINDQQCTCTIDRRRPCEINPIVAFQLVHLLIDGVNMTANFQEKPLFQINLANKELGRRIVKKMMHKDCRCHGVSGSCEMQTCRMRPARLEDIARELYSRAYTNARRVYLRSFPFEFEENRLVYVRRSIDYCQAHPFIDYAGVQQGRECFNNQVCQRVCCQRGFETISRMENFHDCHCRFSWRIVNVQCETCQREITRMICT